MDLLPQLVTHWLLEAQRLQIIICNTLQHFCVFLSLNSHLWCLHVSICTDSVGSASNRPSSGCHSSSIHCFRDCSQNGHSWWRGEIVLTRML